MEEDAEEQRRHDERGGKGNRGASDTLLIRDRRSPLHSRCTAGDSPRPSRTPYAGRRLPLTTLQSSRPAGLRTLRTRSPTVVDSSFFHAERGTEGGLFR